LSAKACPASRDTTRWSAKSHLFPINTIVTDESANAFTLCTQEEIQKKDCSLVIS